MDNERIPTGGEVSEGPRAAQGYRAFPDYEQPPPELDTEHRERLLARLVRLYGKEAANACLESLVRLLRVHHAHKTLELLDDESRFDPAMRFSERDCILITYGDLVREEGETPLDTLDELCRTYLHGVFNTIHVLPFFPWSSDRGFAVMDFETVDPDLGAWDDIAALNEKFRLMFDGVFNHVSAESRWFREFLDQNPDVLSDFTWFDSPDAVPEDLRRLILRPRTSDVLTRFTTLNGPRWVWTTFSPDQVDLDFHNPRVFVRIVEILLFYVRRGAGLLRLDAVTYLWEELGTSCAHLEQTHETIRLFRDLLDLAAPHVALVTETNVPHEENVSYFGNGHDEAQMIYNFALPPLVLHAFQTGNASVLSRWAASLEPASDATTFLNFLDSHDGIGVMAVRDILSSEEVEAMARRVLEHGGFISYRSDGEGRAVPYELNITWYSAINCEGGGEDLDLQVRRYLASRSIALALRGVPGVYLHGLLGSPNDAGAVIDESHHRSINRRTLSKEELVRLIEDPTTSTFKVARGLVALIRRRCGEAAFHPNAEQSVPLVDPRFFVCVRRSRETGETVVAITHCRGEAGHFEAGPDLLGVRSELFEDLLTKTRLEAAAGRIEFDVQPFGIHWFKAVDPR